MPRQGQIIPEYLVPHVQTYINDNSIFTDTVSSPSEDGIRSIHVFASAKGEDGVLKAFDNYTDYLEEYGTPNYALYGQPCYMPYVALLGGNAKCWCMRIMPETATYANAIIVANVKKGTKTVVVTPAEEEVLGEDGSVVTPAKPEVTEEKPILLVKFTSVKVDDLTDKESLAALMIEQTSTTAGDDGYAQYPIMAIAAKGRGAYGNSLRLRITTDTASDTENDYKNYVFEVLDSDGGLTKKETFYGSLVENSVVANTSLYVEDVIGDDLNGSKKLEVAVSSANLNAIYELYKSTVTLADNEEYVPFDEFDFVGGMTKSKVAINGYSVDNTDDDALTLDRTDGILLSGGDDSTFDAAANATERDNAINAEYLKAFQGEEPYDTAILSKRRSPAEFIMDAGYSNDVKMAIAQLALKRYDARCIIDAGIINTTTSAKNWASDMLALDDRIISKECQHFKVKDPFTGKIMPVTITYFLAAELPNHYANYGNHIPFVGSRYAQLTGYVKNSLKPMIDADDLDTKESLYNNRVNFFECIAEDTYVRGTQGTSQTIWSDLSEENNVAVMLDMKRQVEEYVGTKLYNFAEPEDRALFTEDVDRMFADYINSKVRSFSVVFDMNAYEEERSILHCYLSIVFRTMAKRGIIEIDINKRV